MSTKAQHRVFALVMAVLFLATTVAGAALVIWQMRQESEQASSTQQAEDTQSINDLLNEQLKEQTLEGTQLNDFTPVDNIAELQKIDLQEGTGEEVKPGASVTAHYTGAVAATGIIFQSSLDRGQPIPFSLNGVIQGWTEGVPGMKVGGKRRLLIPADKAYGANPPAGSGIPANADLVFDIELVSVDQ